MQYTLRVYKNGELVNDRRTSKIKRFYHIIQAEENSEDKEYHLCVRYGAKSTNEGMYATKEELVFALRAFTEAYD